jgi:hypothetical protein
MPESTLKKLTTVQQAAVEGAVLTNVSDDAFWICISHRLQNKYEFCDLKQRGIRSFNDFVRKCAGRRITEVDKLYLRKPDKNDIYNSYQVQHYGTSDGFRIHGYFANGLFHVIRVDPNHKKHRE